MDDRDGILARLNSHDTAVVSQAALDAADASRADAVPTLSKPLEVVGCVKRSADAPYVY